MSKWKIGLVLALFLGVVGYLVISGLGETTVYYHTVGEVLSGRYHAEAPTFRVSGLVLSGSVVRAQDGRSMDFRLAETPRSGSILVHFRGSVPDNFREGLVAVVEGRYSPSTRQFEAGSILLKCPSKYEKKTLR